LHEHICGFYVAVHNTVPVGIAYFPVQK
jgi:hypothetical protein